MPGESIPVSSIECVNTCTSFYGAICASNASCASGKECKPLSGVPEYSACQ